MKKILFPIFTLCIALAACDNVELADRFEATTTDTIHSTPGKFLTVTHKDLTTGEEITLPLLVEQHLLIEDYTGTACTNCPEMAKFIEEELCEMGVPCEVACMHPQGLTQAMFITSPEAAEYGTRLGNLASLPAIGINRAMIDKEYSDHLLDGTLPATFDKCRAAVVDQAKRFEGNNLDNLLGVSVTAKPVADGSYRLYTAVHADFAPKGDVQLMLWLLADSISAIQHPSRGELALPQAGFTGTYLHRHAFRRAINSTWGETVAGFDADGNLVIEHLLTLTQSDGECDFAGTKCPMIIDHYEVLAVLYDKSSLEVINCCKVDL
ncbi:MAG: Omp28-related outer membrane protein [Bacteroidales bacterium]|nr:Omp28-related outer membrane protein [Candidatus Liminaster caballi]